MRDIVNNYIQKFNSDEQTEHSNEIKNADCFDWFSANVPTFSCSDKTVEETYYFRYWTYRKHIKKTEDGHVVTEFFPDVPWAGNDNAIVCPVVHHIREGRWLKDGGFLLDYIRHYLTGRGSGENVLHYQSGFVAAAGEYLLTQCDAKVLSELAPALENLYLRMKEKYKTAYPDLYWSDDNRDGMEYSLSGNGIRPTINSYMAAGAGTLGRVFKKLGEAEKADAYFAEYGRIANNVDRILWDEKDGFYKNRHTEARDGTPDFGLTDPDRNVMEEIGYIPFMYGIGGKDRRSAFRYLTDPKHFDAPFGPTTADRSHPRFRTVNVHHECLWDGPSWPFATSQTLTALAEVLKDGGEGCPLTKEDYASLLHKYAACHTLTENSRTVNWIDEDLDEQTGEWLARKILKTYPDAIPERGIYYNHSTFGDLVISGLFGLTPTEDGFTVHPLIPDGWESASVAGVSLHGHRISVSADRADGWRITVDDTPVFTAERKQEFTYCHKF